MTRSTPARLYQLRSKSTISPAAGQVLDVALEIPLRLLALGRRAQRDHAADARVEAGRDRLDRAALAGRVAPLEQHDDLEPGVPDPLLEAVQLDVEPRKLLLVGLPVELCGPGLHGGRRVPPAVLRSVGLPVGSMSRTLAARPPRHRRTSRPVVREVFRAPYQGPPPHRRQRLRPPLQASRHARVVERNAQTLSGAVYWSCSKEPRTSSDPACVYMGWNN